MKSSPFSRNLFPLLLFLLYCSIRWSIQAGEIFWGTGLIPAAVVILLLIQIYRWNEGGAPSIWELLVWAALFRSLFLFDTPQLSDDIYRYILDGTQVALGRNPYLLPPAQIPPHSLPLPIRHGVLPHVNHPGLVTIYPPLAQWLFFLGALISPSPWGIKLILVALDLILVAVIWRLSPEGSPLPAAYAWHPLPVVEIGHSGHIDGSMALFALLAVFLLWKERAGWSGLFLGLSVATKLTTLVFAPFMLLQLRHPSAACRFLLCLLLGVLIPSLWFCDGLLEMFSTLTTYLRHWEFSGALYQLLRNRWGGEAARLLLLGAFTTGIAAVPLLTRDLYQRLSLAFLIFLVTQPTLYPWYALPLAALAPLAWCPGSMPFLWALGLSYGVLLPYKTLGVWQEWTSATWIIFFTGLVALGWMAVSCSPSRPVGQEEDLPKIHNEDGQQPG